MSETVKVPPYPDATVNFGVINTLSVSATTNTIELGKPVQITIYANDPITHVPVAGKVMSDRPTGLAGKFAAEHQIGSTNTHFTDTFKARNILTPRT